MPPFIAKIHLLSYCLFKGVIVVRIAFWIVFAFVGILIFGIVGGLIGRKKRK
ncbi:LPXTG cell wall anchor domain-containing protein [Paenibacillus sp. LMG 31459]|uniref:LPXTG cell wall anchor domain-containing protein n=1 Tax=Paenibacillus phytohabitans TaxID=2654978 RepID=A0ABX1YER8_9BACL|nr:LPXTG cell wall anchor domain-containing protein [Paenibacillus phytohabitans]